MLMYNIKMNYAVQFITNNFRLIIETSVKTDIL